MAKKRIFGLILSSVVTIGVMLFSHATPKDGYVVKADGNELVGTPTIGWNNVDYSLNMSLSWAPHVDEVGIPQQGYCLLPLYPSDIAASVKYDENLLTANIPGCNVGNHILINGIESQNVEDVIIYCYPTTGFFIYVPHSSVAFSDEYEYVTIEVLEGMSIDGTAQTVATRFEYRGILGSHGKWEVNPTPIEKVNGEFSKIDWNNKDFSYTTGDEWAGELSPSGSPVNGYCVLAFFNEEGKTYNESVIGDMMTKGRGVIGKGLNADTKIKVNGVNIVDVAGAICYIYPSYGLFFYVPEASLTYDETYQHPTIELEKGLHFNNVYLPHITFVFRGERGEPNGWTYIRDYDEYNKYPFTKVADLWNNVPVDSGHNHTVLQFGENTPEHIDYLKNDKISDGTNLINRYSDCGNKITINGRPLYEIEEAVVNYMHGYGYVYMALPISALVPSNGYKIVTLHIEQDTIFFDSLLPEVTLYLFNGIWVTEKPITPADSDYDGALSLSATFGSEQLTLDGNNKQASATKECSINNFGLFIDYKLMEENTAFVIYAAGAKNYSGLRVVFRGNEISLYDATESSTLLGKADVGSFVYDEWYSLFLFTKVEGNNLSINVAIDDIIYITATDVVLDNPANIGNLFSLNLGSGSVSFKNAVLGADNKKPTITYNGKYLYSVLTGSEAIDFASKCSAFDTVDGDVSAAIQYNWPVGSLTGNKVNKGVWEVAIVASDSSNNKAQVIVTVIAADKLDVTVTFDGKNPVNYRVGDHIANIPEPIKEGYRFIGWYYNNRLWDFENDYVVMDMDLVSRFVESAEEHCVTFTIEGIKGLTSYNLYFAHGTELSIQTFAKDGYSLKAYVNDVEVETITVTENMSVKLVYTSNNSSNKKGCGGEIISAAIFIPILLGGAIIVLVSLKKKGGKEHE